MWDFKFRTITNNELAFSFVVTLDAKILQVCCDMIDSSTVNVPIPIFIYRSWCWSNISLILLLSWATPRTFTTMEANVKPMIALHGNMTSMATNLTNRLLPMPHPPLPQPLKLKPWPRPLFWKFWGFLKGLLKFARFADEFSYESTPVRLNWCSICISCICNINCASSRETEPCLLVRWTTTDSIRYQDQQECIEWAHHLRWHVL